MFCIKCGSELNDGARFCKKCGARVPNNLSEDNLPNTAVKPSSEVVLNQYKNILILTDFWQHTFSDMMKITLKQLRIFMI